MKKAIYAGSFDPITSGHVDIIKRGAKVFDKIYVVLMENTTKSHLFSLDERVRFLKESIKDLGDRVEVDVYTGLIADYCNIKDTYILIRGLRALTDFEYEFQMATINRKLNKEVESVFFVASNEYTYVSSSNIKQIAEFGGDVSTMVPECVNKALIEKYKGE
ncbi:pantetheine-phosphate adenylyltransferase [Anaerofustis stercorihominis]|uniref:Phosphopantetheine adenylyltransferase n=2 Tax=Anaerofustis stercorihominis TaxID=214853 RepID=B1C9D2_9FIRM|nr:pantetheine-phosphate adenylyltransferase [Anaerofustis stercorihominis]EDS72296.1 pantetheine-phosphate adenylyltransferase [Anaerofustis stercorihominis DSM 17244]MCQ4795106.1 pantetheine-phosphate adenylyltransferase [Anaerofustis stercorihominis]RGD73163.1 pantetheine-phosphate adenylyltransferase [Anaerofustis stercorihominis]